MRKETERKKERKERTLITFGKLLAEIAELERIMKDEGI